MVMRPSGGPPGTSRKPIAKATLGRVVGTFSPYRLQLASIALLVLASAAPGLVVAVLPAHAHQRRLAASRPGARHALHHPDAARHDRRTGAGAGLRLSFDGWSGSRSCATCATGSTTTCRACRCASSRARAPGKSRAAWSATSAACRACCRIRPPTCLSNVATVLSTLVAMIYMDWRLTLLSVGILPLFAVHRGQSRRLFARACAAQSQQQLADLNATMQETLSVSGVLLTKTSGRRGLAMAEVRARERGADRHADAPGHDDALLLQPASGLTFSLTPVLVYWLAGWLIVAAARRHADPRHHRRVHLAAVAPVLSAHQPAQRAGGSHQRPGAVRPHLRVSGPGAGDQDAPDAVRSGPATASRARSRSRM